MAEKGLLKTLNKEKNYYAPNEKKKLLDFFGYSHRNNQKTTATIEELDGKRYFINGEEAEDIVALRKYEENINNFPKLNKTHFYGDDSRYKQFLYPFQAETKSFVENRIKDIIKDSLRYDSPISIRFEDKIGRKIKKITIIENQKSKTLNLNA